LRVADTRAEPGGLAAQREALAQGEVEYRLGCEESFDTALLDDVDQVVLSPGLAPAQAPAAALLREAEARGIEVVGEIELFARALAELAGTREYRPRLLAVTGTNGKTTVTALTRQLVEASGLSAVAAGNIGPAALAALMTALDADALPQVWVLELSSFQLETTRSLMADAAVVLNVTQDHLDWHGGMDAYAQAKARLLKMARIAIVNREDPYTVGMVPSLNAMNVRSFGRDVPELVGDMGLELGQGVAWLTASEPNDFDEPAPPPRRKKDAPEPVRAKGRMSRLMPVDALRIRGIHNALNALAALQLARCLDLGWGAMLRALREYAGEPHRAAFVRTIGGVDYINDSKGTNVGATVAALEGLGQPVVLIAGGQGKGQDFSPLIPVVSRHARAVMLIGVDGPEIGRVLASTGVNCVAVETLRDAVRGAAELAQPGDAVLLSPACASLDMFRNYPQRGQVFVEEVEDLARDRGEIA
jgi:UDP-N-acetylmuramoylalanine--D-glutamate ligase